MNLQAKLTLGNVLLGVLMVTIISVMDLAFNVQQQFDATLERAEVINPVATKFVRQTLNSRLTVSMREALRDERLSKDFLDLVTDARAILEIAVVNPQTNEVLADSDPTRLGQISGPYSDFRELVQQTGSYSKMRVLTGHGPEYYQLERALASGGETVLLVRVIIAPALIRNDIKPTLKSQANVAIWTVAGAICVTLLFSAIAFRPLGRLRRQLDLVASGEYEPEKAIAKPANDELSQMASKVNLLGQRLRGAQY